MFDGYSSDRVGRVRRAAGCRKRAPLDRPIQRFTDLCGVQREVAGDLLHAESQIRQNCDRCVIDRPTGVCARIRGARTNTGIGVDAASGCQGHSTLSTKTPGSLHPTLFPVFADTFKLGESCYIRGSRSGPSDFVREWAARGEIRDACERRAENCRQGLACEECLVAGQDHVRERDEPLDHVVGNHRAR
jgi:hypothetical protein